MTARRALAWCAAGAAAFTLYGSLVPFHFRALTLGRACELFGTLLAEGVWVYSRSDLIANVMLGGPLGFFLLGAARADREPSAKRALLAASALLPLCALFAFGVEFAQQFTATRNCALSDIAAQALGSALGMLAWAAKGPALVRLFRALWARTDPNPAARVLLAYLALLLLIQTLPFDVSISPYELYKKVRDGGVTFVPFAEFRGATDDHRWELYGKLAKLAGLFFPVGLLLSRANGRAGRWGAAKVTLAALAVALCTEGAQLFVRARAPSATDVLVGASAALVAWYAARVHSEGLALPFAVSWFVVWLAALTPAYLPRPGAPRLDAPRAFDWVPFAAAESGDPMHVLEDVLTKLVLFGLLGAIVAARVLPPKVRRGPSGSVRTAALVSAALGLLVSALVESAQRATAAHTPGVTDVLLGGVGAALGALAARAATRDRVLRLGGVVTTDAQPDSPPAAPPSAPEPAHPEPPLTVVEPRPGWALPDFRELWRYRELLYFLALRDIKVRYAQTALGVGWALAQPLATMAVFALFLGRVGGVGKDVPNYPLFVYAGMVAWTFFGNTISTAALSVVSNERLVTKIYFPRLAIPLATAGVGLFDLVLATALLGGLALLWGVGPGWSLLLLPVVALALTVAAAGIGVLLSALVVAQRDFKYVLTFGVQLWMFATPSLYLPPESFGETARLWLPLNPAHGLVAAFRQSALGQPIDWYAFGVSAAVGAALALFGMLYFRRVERTFADTI